MVGGRGQGVGGKGVGGSRADRIHVNHSKSKTLYKIPYVF